MARDVIMTRELPTPPRRADDAHKGDVGRVMVIGGCCTDAMMVGAPAMAATAALRSGCGLVQMLVPAEVRGPAAILSPCATLRSLPEDPLSILQAIDGFRADVVALGPGLGDSLDSAAVAEIVRTCRLPMVVDADGLNRLSEAAALTIPEAERIVLTPHPGEARRLLQARRTKAEFDSSAQDRREFALALHEAYGCTIVLKGAGTVVTNGERLYLNGTGNPGMATGGTGDVLTGVIASLIAQGLAPFEAAMLGVYLHGLAGDFASEELGRRCMIATDLIDYLPEAFAEHELGASE